MESSIEASVHELAQFGPEWVMALAILVVIVVLACKFGPLIKQYVDKRLQILDAESKHRIDLENKHEERKAKEQKEREQRDRERSEFEGKLVAQNERSIIAIENSNTAINAINAQIAALNSRLDDSKVNSRAMGDSIDEIHEMVKDIHRETVR